MSVLILRDPVLLSDAHPERAVAFINQANPLVSPPALPEKLLAPAWVCWSGWIEDDTPRPAESVEQDFRSWSREGWQRFEGWCDELVPRLRERSIELWLRPHCRHVLSDPQSCASFLARRPGQPIRLLFEPSAFLTIDMLASAEDHLERAFAALGSHPGVAAVLLTNRLRAAAESEPLQAAPLHRGEVNPDLFARLWRQHVPHDLPVALLSDELEQQRRVLGLH